MSTFVIRNQIRASRERVWEVLMGLMAGADGEPEYERLGDPAPHGPGAIKEIDLFGYPMREETTALDPPRRRAYRLISGMPVDSYNGEVTLEEQAGETEIVWKAVIDSDDPALTADFAEKCRGILEVAVRFVSERSESE